ncbi:MAG TPA: PDZ domain-containing protein [Gemmatimonadaceae bacterium]|nr:PDZ domain-containing protein [Gemmatimonadaceae bacterium]
MLSDKALFNESGTAFFDRYPIVSKVEDNSPASKAGVRPGDVLMTFNSHDMRGATLHLNEWLTPGAPFELRLRRGENVRLVRGRVEPRPEGWQQVAIVEISPSEEIIMRPRSPDGASGGTRTIRVRTPGPAPARLPSLLVPALGYGAGVYPFLGAEFTPLNPDLCELFGVKPEGVFVTSVAEGSIARESGLRGGDVVITADNTKIEDPNDLVRAIRSADDRSVKLEIIRKRKAQTVTLSWKDR